MNTTKTSPAPREAPARPGDQLASGGGRRVDLAAALSTRSSFAIFDTWIIGLSPLIVHAWSHKAKIEILTKQAKAVKGRGREQRNPEQDFIDSIYKMPNDALGREAFGFPATGLKKAILSAAHKDKGLARTAVTSSLWLDAAMVSVRPALAGAVCDMPLVRIWGSAPEMREDMVKIGTMTKTANFAYRAQFRHWAINLRGRFIEPALNETQLVFLINESGIGNGIGEWRNEKTGVFGAYTLASSEEERAWRAYADGTGPLPVPAKAIAAE